MPDPFGFYSKSGTISKPGYIHQSLSVSFRSGITGRARNPSVMKGSVRVAPRLPGRNDHFASICRLTVSTGWSDINPATGRGRSASTLPSFDCREAAAHLHDDRDRCTHVPIGGTGNDDVVGVVGHAGSDGAASCSPNPVTNPLPVRAVSGIAVHHGQS
jgi:hypothetical protein